MKKKLTALVLSLVLAAMPATPVMNVQTVSAATTTRWQFRRIPGVKIINIIMTIKARR